MKQYDFTLRFALGRPEADAEGFLSRLHEEGCDDALVGIGRPGQIALNFSREASSASEAVLGALEAVRRALPDAKFLEAAPDFVGVPDIAELLGVSRQYIGKILQQSAGEFPPAIHSGTRAIWHMETVLTWLVQYQGKQVDTALHDVSRINMLCNHARERSHLADEEPDRYLQAVC